MPFKIRAEVEPRWLGSLGGFCDTVRSFRFRRGLASAAFEDHHFHGLGQGRCSVGNNKSGELVMRMAATATHMRSHVVTVFNDIDPAQ